MKPTGGGVLFRISNILVIYHRVSMVTACEWWLASLSECEHMSVGGAGGAVLQSKHWFLATHPAYEKGTRLPAKPSWVKQVTHPHQWCV